MLPKKNRVDKKSIDLIFKEGSFIGSASFTFKFIKTNDNKKQISFIVPKNVARLANKRNFLRRKGYIVLEKYFKNFPIGFFGVFIFRKYQDDILILENEIKDILNKIN